MNFELGSPVIEIAIGLSFVFFLLSVIASALNEFCSGLLNLRAKTLRDGLEGMIGDKEAVEKLFEHALVRTDLSKDASKKPFSFLRRLERFLPRTWRKYEQSPSYLSPDLFARAFDQVFGELKDKAPAPATQGGSPDPKDVVRREAMKSQVSKLLDGVGVDKQLKALESWFDDGMERVSGWYKRKSQVWVVVFAVIVAIGLNASAVRIAERLNNDPTVRAAVVAKAEAAAEQGSKTTGDETETTGGEAETTGAKEIRKAGEDASGAIDKLGDLKLPLFWAKDNLPQPWNLANILTLAGGWFLTVVAVSLGAPFWFDALSRLSNLRLTGKKPEDEAQKPKA